MKNITTERLTLRAWHETDVDFAYDLYSRWVVQRFIGVEPAVMKSRAEAEERVARFQSIDHPVHGVWAVTRSSDGLAVGALLLKPIPASGEEPLEASNDVEIGWHFHPDHWGNGYATEAAAAVLEHAFSSGLDQVVAVTNPANEASQTVCRRLGMSHEGQTELYYNASCELFTIASPASNN
ncbi:MAG: GNAT family N-acetyltransferase [Specibacter sp.]